MNGLNEKEARTECPGLLQHHQQTYHHRKEGSTFHESGGQDHVGAQVVDGFRLAGHGLNCVTTDATDTDTGTNSGETSAEGGDTISSAEVEENRKEHVFEV